jgi:L-ascorbate metabolism protein UlaG (beta-lactamase superfamily)
MELTWYGRTCVRMKGRDALVVADAYQSIVGPTGRGLTADIATFSHADDNPLAKAKGKPSRNGETLLPASLETAFVLDSPGEYEVKDVLVAAVRTFRDEHRGAERGRNVAFLVELDGVHVIHLGDIGHLLTEEKLADIGSVDVACVPVGGSLSATKTAELIAQLDPRIVIPMTIADDEAAGTEAMKRFLHEMSAEPVVQARLSVTPSGLPAETTTILLEQRGRT